jgi:hypothetical protein
MQGERGYTTVTVSKQLYRQLQERAKKENKKVATYASELMETMLYVEEKFLNYVPFLELVSLNDNEVIIRDSKNDRIVGVKAKAADGGKVKFYCELDDNTDYCPHTAFAAALPQVRNAIRR